MLRAGQGGLAGATREPHPARAALRAAQERPPPSGRPGWATERCPQGGLAPLSISCGAYPLCQHLPVAPPELPGVVGLVHSPRAHPRQIRSPGRRRAGSSRAAHERAPSSLKQVAAGPPTGAPPACPTFRRRPTVRADAPCAASPKTRAVSACAPCLPAPRFSAPLARQPSLHPAVARRRARRRGAVQASRPNPRRLLRATRAACA
jgi:hypothetical protein